MIAKHLTKNIQPEIKQVSNEGGKNFPRQSSKIVLEIDRANPTGPKKEEIKKGRAPLSQSKTVKTTLGVVNIRSTSPLNTTKVRVRDRTSLTMFFSTTFFLKTATS